MNDAEKIVTIVVPATKAYISVYLSGERLQVAADVAAAGLRRLITILEKHAEILALLEAPASSPAEVREIEP